MLDAHCGLPRQFSVCAQQLPTMHCEHGVPPGSRLHAPASTGGTPQWPPLHTRPTQHCGLLTQFDPVGKHEPAPQMPFWQTFVQHSLFPLHGKPSSLHCAAPQTPFVQLPVQHWDGMSQPKPSGWHWLKPQVKKFGSQKAEQQSKPLSQKKPSGWHSPAVQTLSGPQMPEQHSFPTLQLKLLGRH